MKKELGSPLTKCQAQFFLDSLGVVKQISNRLRRSSRKFMEKHLFGSTFAIDIVSDLAPDIKSGGIEVVFLFIE
jgi:hypothetical protein